MIRLCDPCRTGQGTENASARQLCASRLTRCKNRPILLRGFVAETASKRDGSRTTRDVVTNDTL